MSDTIDCNDSEENIEYDEFIENEDMFFFESDFLVLRGNSDYRNIMKTIVVLEMQRMRIQSQLKELIETKKLYMNRPDLLLNKLARNEQIISPNRMEIAELPEIKNDDVLLKLKKQQRLGNESSLTMVRGRTRDESKPLTFNKLWSYEEQIRLEQLLVEYPPEKKESHRYAKIAKALGNRTPHQVASRVQKYYQKLTKVGMRQAGRRTNGHIKSMRLYRPTTFFPQLQVPVVIDETDDSIDSAEWTSSTDVNSSFVDDDMDSNDCKEPNIEWKDRILQILEALRKEKSISLEGYNPDPLAPKCEECNISPTTRTRWRCNTCKCIIYRCADCFLLELDTEQFDHTYHNVVLDREL